MLNENQILILHNFAAAVANKYGALSIEDINIKKIDPQLDGIDENDILYAISQMQDRRFKIYANTIYTTQKPMDQLDKIFACYDEYEKPKNITFQDVKDYVDMEKLPITDSLVELKNYCIEKSNLSDKIEKSHRFNWAFNFSANGITLSDYYQISPYVAQFFEIDNNDELKKLCIKALEHQVSWMCAGRTAMNNKYRSLFSEAANKAFCSVSDVYSVHCFCQCASNFYGYILIRDVYRIYRNLYRGQDVMSKDQFTIICDVASSVFSIYQIDGALVSLYLMDESSLNYWSEKTKKDFQQEYKSNDSMNPVYLSILLLIREQGKSQFYVPTIEEFRPYQSPLYVKSTTPYTKLLSLVRKNNQDFNILLFNRNFNYFSNMIGEDVSKLRSDAIKYLEIQNLEDTDKLIATELLEQAISEVPCWALRGFSQKEDKKRK